MPISEYESFDRLIGFVSNEWEKKKIFFEDYKMIYHRLISSMKWKLDHVFFETKIKNGKQRFRKNVWQNSRCHIQNIHLQILPCEDISIEKGICVSYCQKEDVEAAGWRKKGAPQKKSSTFLKVFLIDTVKIMNF